MTILVNIMKYHMFMNIFSIETTILQNKTLVFAHWAAGETHTSLSIPATVWRFSPCIPVVTCWPPTPICRYWGCESEQLSGCASLTGCAVLWFGRPYTTGPPRVVYKEDNYRGEEQQWIHVSITLTGILNIQLAAQFLSCYLYLAM